MGVLLKEYAYPATLSSSYMGRPWQSMLNTAYASNSGNAMLWSLVYYCRIMLSYVMVINLCPLSQTAAESLYTGNPRLKN